MKGELTMMHVDMWYGNKVSDVDRINITFYPNVGEYRGNVYIAGKTVGDYSTKNSLEIEKTFPQLIINWD